jgi:hypothetical protein
MKVVIYGYVRPSLEKKIIEASNFYASILMSKKLCDKLTVDIEIESTLEDNNMGECFPEDETKSPRYFTIRLLKKNDDCMLKALAHEFVHLKQYAKNELSYKFKSAKKLNPKLDFVWMGKFWKPKKNEHIYWDSPWELEAYAKEPGLFYKFISVNSR